MTVDLITPVVEGASVRVGDGARALVTVGPKCDVNTGRWFCVTHNQGFANQFQKDTHIHSGKPMLAWVCFEHGVEVP